MSTFKALLAMLVLTLGCATREPPAEFSIDPAFSPAEAETIRAGVDAWCDAVGWCPTEVARADRGHFSRVPSLSAHGGDCPEGLECIVGGYNDGDNVEVAADFLAQEDLGVVFSIIEHEIGHFCTGHTDTGIMSLFHPAADGAEPIDAVAVSAWREGCR